jgi:hypothetical protein
MKQWMIIALILFWLGWHLAVPVDLIKSDLGRHIINGELIVHGNWDVLYKNYYSYTNPQYPFINHHWLFGVFCFFCWHYFGFTGLSFIYLMLELSAFYLFFHSWQRYSSFTMACAFGLLSFPLICFRSEVRPEGISYLFCGLFWWLIDSYQQKRLKPHHLIIGLCFLQVIWVNTHIFFIIGPILTALFWLQARVNKEEQQAEILQKLFFLLLGMCLINPSGINGLLAPFHIDKAYTYPVQEISSVFNLLNDKISPFRIFLLYFLAAIGMLGAALFFLVRRDGFKKYIFIGSLTLILSLLAMKAVRIIGLFGFFWIPLTTYVFSSWFQSETTKFRKNIEIVLLILGIIVSVSVNCDWKQSHGLGIVPGCNDAAEFFKWEKISGPIFNNYDIGGYLIFHLSPGYKLFVDNRNDAFPKDFLMKTFIQMQKNEDLWHKMDLKYHFNVIFITPELSDWQGRFLLHRFEDPAWAAVYLKGEALILLKRNAQNDRIIRRNELLPDKIKIISASSAMPTQIIMLFKGRFLKAD